MAQKWHCASSNTHMGREKWCWGTRNTLLLPKEPRHCHLCGNPPPSLSPCMGGAAQCEEHSKAFTALFTFDLNRTRKLQYKG